MDFVEAGLLGWETLGFDRSLKGLTVLMLEASVNWAAGMMSEGRRPWMVQ